MPYPNEHAIRLTEPNYKKYARKNDAFGKGIDAIYGIKEDGKTELQAIRFDASKFTFAEAKRWANEHDHSAIKTEEASGKMEKSKTIALMALGFKQTEQIEKDKKEVQIKILKQSDVQDNMQKRLVYGIVLKPETPDFQGDSMGEDDIMFSAHNFMLYYRNAGEMHENFADASLVESYLAPVDFELNGNKVTKGSWIVAFKITSEDLWMKILSGVYTAFSAGGYGVRKPISE